MTAAHPRNWTASWLLALVLVAFGVGNASAVNYVTNCSQTCTANCVLFSDINCNGADGVILTSGADLDMAGHYLTCTANCPGAAVKMTSGSSIVKNTTGEGGIMGVFNVGVNCQSNSSSEVNGIRIETATYAIQGCAKVSNNVVVDDSRQAQVAISMGGVANSDYVKDNYVEGYRTAITTATSHNLLIQHNEVVLRNAAGGGQITGIFTSPSGTPTIQILNNALFGDATIADFFGGSNSGTSYLGNVCDPDDPLCQACTHCAQPVAPFNQ